jgi:hypothetical protein
MCALVLYDAWLSQEALREDSLSAAGDWDWAAIEALLGHL